MLGAGDGAQLSPVQFLGIACVATVAVSLLTVGSYYCFVVLPRAARLSARKKKKQKRREKGDGGGPRAPRIDTAVYSLKTRQKVAAAEPLPEPPSPRGELRVLYATVKGASRAYAEAAAAALGGDGWAASAACLSTLPPDAGVRGGGAVLFVLPTYEGGVPPPAGRAFVQWLRDRADRGTDRDFSPLNSLRYSVLGLGHSDYARYNAVAKEVDDALRRLHAQPLAQGLVLGDEGRGTLDAAHAEWVAAARAALRPTERPGGGGCGGGGGDSSGDEGGVGDMEDLAVPAGGPSGEMIHPRMRRALTKQGYRLLGTHSGVKLCRWTQSQLRGRGGCYKHTFYGIVSYRCMEMTPSLACANKCVFCWRHHTNPVATEWRWKHDAPETLIEQAIEGQRAMIKPLKGVPGVDPERYADAMNPRHCALSLVGEPIIYPEINRLLAMMHERGISSFLVTNAQFPEKIESLSACTQLYVSIDAATEDTLKAVDRPIFSDFWERFLQSIDAMRRKGTRTVFRLTLVKAWNGAELQEYAHLVQRGRPDFIEVKGVTWCGESSASRLTMSNVPFHKEVLQFCSELADACGEGYALASEHEHSCCVLIANTRFRRDGVWNTWIDFDRFGDLVRRGGDFRTDDYLLPTPDWAQYGHASRGFDPAESRFVKQRNHPGRD